MGTSLTPEFWERFAVLLLLAVGLTGVLATVFARLADRLPRHRAHSAAPRVSSGPDRSDHRMPVHS
ncbi:hypothetical protein GCM10010269_24210 [Streptomyces humidus]|uniref:Uncharacterized protein n=1 Tax=Streptomyces humidus TaxID=52259 RepID=A0A918FU54_9ACTN|nr:hypothetical protein [Streptomyces humidus]GGR84204.1 hypothetical protein GCM10010269_24210 [Streptomyces humidus]